MRIDNGQPGNNASAELPIGAIGRAAEHVRQFLCGLHGHDALLHFEKGRMFLQCTSCGYETPGWEVKPAPARPEAPQAARHITRLPFISERRVA